MVNKYAATVRARADVAEGSTPGSVGGGSEGKAGSDGGLGGQSCTSGSAAPGTAPGQGGQGLIDTTLAGTWSWSEYGYSCPAADIGAAGQASGDGKRGGALGHKGDKGYQCIGRPHDYPGAGGPGVDGPAGGCGAAAQPSPWSAGSFDGTSWMASKGDDGEHTLNHELLAGCRTARCSSPPSTSQSWRHHRVDRCAAHFRPAREYP